MTKAESTAKLSSRGNWMRGVRHITGRGKAQHTDLTWECAYCVQGSAKDEQTAGVESVREKWEKGSE